MWGLFCGFHQCLRIIDPLIKTLNQHMGNIAEDLTTHSIGETSHHRQN